MSVEWEFWFFETEEIRDFSEPSVFGFCITPVGRVLATYPFDIHHPPGQVSEMSVGELGDAGGTIGTGETIGGTGGTTGTGITGGLLFPLEEAMTWTVLTTGRAILFARSLAE